MNKSELLMPAGSLRKLKLAILYGADAVYMGTPDLSLRTKSQITLDDLVEGIEFAHDRGKRVYLTLNLFSHNKDIPKLEKYLETVRKVNPDGLIIADPGVFQYVKERAPEIPLHISTQSNICSWLSIQFWEQQGAELCVLAREVSFSELEEIREKCPNMKLEAFVHGSMCMTYSGRCLLSNFMAERGANQGNCANSCRWNYKFKMRLKDGTIKELNLTEENLELFEFLLEEECRPGDLLPIEEDGRGAYILNSKDLCLLPKLNDYLRIGVDSLKVEGRSKSEYYAAIVARAYRMAIDAYYEDPDNWSPKPYMKELAKVANRGYTLAFHEGRLTNYAHNYVDTRSIAEWEYAGLIQNVEDGCFHLEVKNKLEAGDVLEFVSPTTKETVLLRIYEFENINNGQVTEAVHAGLKPLVKIPFSLFDQEDPERLKELFPEFTVVRKEKAMTQQEWDRIKFDRVGQKLEISNTQDDDLYLKRKDKLEESKIEDEKDRQFKSPRLGTEGCCGKGCNGCLIFWNDPIYEKARTVLAKRRQGEQLTRQEGRELKTG